MWTTITALTGPYAFGSALLSAGQMATHTLACEPWRCVTALTLHLDADHFATNAVAGLTFTGILSRRTGLGVALAVGVAGGAGGNALDAWALAPAAPWVGASTAVFALLGALCAAYRSAAAVLLSAVLAAGAHGAGINSGAHLCGWIVGLAMGLAVRSDDNEPAGFMAQIALGVSAIATVAACWHVALA